MLWFCGTAFEIMAMIEVILVGVVVNNGIVLIDQVQLLRRSGVERNQAVLEGCLHSFTSHIDDSDYHDWWFNTYGF